MILNSLIVEEKEQKTFCFSFVSTDSGTCAHVVNIYKCQFISWNECVQCVVGEIGDIIMSGFVRMKGAVDLFLIL